MRLVFWWPSACRSIMPLIRELAQLCEDGVRIVVQENLGPNRRQFGWQADSAGNAEYYVLPSEERWKAVQSILSDESQSLHVIGGYQRIPLHRRIIAFAQANKIAYGVMAEAPIHFDLGWKVFLKSVYLSTVIRRRTSQVAAQSLFFACLSGRQYDEVLKVGWPFEKIYPFGYFPVGRSVKSRSLIPTGESCRLLYMGTLVKYKGVDLLLRAVATAQSMGARFVTEIVGDGPEKVRLQSLSKQLGLEGSVVFHGFVADSTLDQIIELSDILVCPGIAEPWGIKINEAIQSGLATISSDRLGASKLISASGAGILFRSGDVGELAECIRCLSQNTEIISYYKMKADEYSPFIHPKEAARHFLEIVKYVNGEKIDRPSNLFCLPRDYHSAKHV